MITLKRIPENPIISPNQDNEWEHDGAFNGCVAFSGDTYHMVYRALSLVKNQNGVDMQVSSVGYAKSKDGIKFTDRKLLFGPTEDWEIFGCEDPRITYMDGKFYIFYTALSVFPFAAYGIKNAVAITADFKTFEKHPVTTFNSKAMALFPEKINGKMAALLTVNTDMPPAKIAFAEFEKESDIWSPFYWTDWYGNINSNSLQLLRDMRDQVELGAPPIKTDAGWIVIYSYIKNYMSNNKEFGIEAMLLDLSDPRQILGRTNHPLIAPNEKYELVGEVKNIVFPAGALIKDKQLFVYYGAADTVTAVATCSLDELLSELKSGNAKKEADIAKNPKKFVRFGGNPILTPSPELSWQSLAVYNPAAIYEDGKVHILYRAQSMDGTSVIGYASSTDGLHIDENIKEPIYIPRESFEIKEHEQGNSGCEDPRIVKIDDRIYMYYTAYDGKNPPRVAMTFISVDDFLNKRWNWERPVLITPPGMDDKDACIVKHGEGYIAFHRLNEVIWIDFLKDMDFPAKNYLDGSVIAQSRKDKWDNVKVGISAPPIETDEGLLLLYHGVSEPGFKYKVGAMLLDKDDPREIIGRTDESLLEPEEKYEIEGQVPNAIFPCGAVVIDGIIYIYYGGADSVVCVATMPLKNLLNILMK